MLIRRSSRTAVALVALVGSVCGLASVASAQTPVLIDINRYSLVSADSSPANFARIGASVVFSANDGTNGTELWITDGTSGNTTLLADINPGSASSSPANLTSFGSRVIFTADNGANGRELWITDGTPSGTVLLQEIVAGSTGATSFSSAFGVIGTFGTPNSFVLFAANNGTVGTELWVTDGTTAGTNLLLDIRSGSPSSIPSGFFSTGGKVYFLANDGGGAGLFGNELWSSDGTLAGTVRLTDIAPGVASSGFSIDAAVNGWGYGVANNLAVGNDQEPTAVNLTTLEVRRLADIRPGTTSSSSQEFVVVGSDVFFRGSATGTDTQLYRVTFDGMGDPIGATLVTDINPSGNDNVGNLAAFDGRVHFAATNGVSGRELWSSDGSATGTT